MSRRGGTTSPWGSSNGTARLRSRIPEGCGSLAGSRQYRYGRRKNLSSTPTLPGAARRPGLGCWTGEGRCCHLVIVIDAGMDWMGNGYCTVVYCTYDMPCPAHAHNPCQCHAVPMPCPISQGAGCRRQAGRELDSGDDPWQGSRWPRVGIEGSLSAHPGCLLGLFSSS